MTSLHHFDVVQRNFFNFSKNFNLKTLKKLQNATLAVKNKKDSSALAEMFSIEFKFTIDCLKFWYNRNLKQIEFDKNLNDEFIQNTPKKTCCTCDFPIKSKTEYQNVKKFFMLLRLKTLGDMNRIYNFQDILILCEIFEQRASLLEKLFKFNPRKCNSASSFSGTVRRNKTKCNIVMPTNTRQIRVFENTLIVGYSCVNTRMVFDTELFLKDLDNEKVILKTRDGQLKRFSSKIIKMDENNHYGFAMTKPLPDGCIKKKKKIF